LKTEGSDEKTRKKQQEEEQDIHVINIHQEKKLSK
jgi:hypothetical protein